MSLSIPPALSRRCEAEFSLDKRRDPGGVSDLSVTVRSDPTNTVY